MEGVFGDQLLLYGSRLRWATYLKFQDGSPLHVTLANELG